MDLTRLIEAALLVASEPLGIDQLQSLTPGGRTPSRADIQQAIDQLTLECAERALELTHTAGGYRYQVRATYTAAVARTW